MDYEAFVINYAQLAKVFDPHWQAMCQPLFTAVAATMTRSLIGWRCHRLLSQTDSARLRAFVYGLALCSFLSIPLAVLTSVMVYGAPGDQFHTVKMTVIMASCLGLSVVIEVASMAMLTYSLARKISGWASTDDLIGGLIRKSLSTGILTALLALSNLLVFLFRPSYDLTYYGVNCVLFRVYSHQFLVLINDRKDVRDAFAKIWKKQRGSMSISRKVERKTPTKIREHSTFEMPSTNKYRSWYSNERNLGDLGLHALQRFPSPLQSAPDVESTESQGQDSLHRSVSEGSRSAETSFPVRRCLSSLSNLTRPTFVKKKPTTTVTQVDTLSNVETHLIAAAIPQHAKSESTASSAPEPRLGLGRRIIDIKELEAFWADQDRSRKASTL